MKPTNNLRCLLFICFLSFVFIAGSFSNALGDDRYYYQIKIYHVKTQAQEERLDSYFQQAYLPALHKLGVKNVGVFKPVSIDTGNRVIYVLIPFKSWSQLENAGQKLAEDKDYLSAGKDYIETVYNNASYTRLETIILRAFPKMPEPGVPDLTASKTNRIYELRSYESASEKYNLNKVRMFNDGDEVALFKRIGFNAVFYSEVVAGSHMPNLMYMVTFNSIADHDKLWKFFFDDPYWKTLSAKSEYQHNVSHVDAIFLHPTAYSDF